MIENLDEDNINMMLMTHIVGRIGCHAKGRTYIVPVSYAYEGGFIYGHTNDGMKIRMIRESPAVCFEVDSIRNFGDWRSVIAWGTFEELDGVDAAHALDILVQRLSSPRPLRKRDPSAEGDIDDIFHGMRLNAKKGVTYRIRVTEKSGRHEATPPS